MEVGNTPLLTCAWMRLLLRAVVHCGLPICIPKVEELCEVHGHRCRAGGTQMCFNCKITRLGEKVRETQVIMEKEKRNKSGFL